MRPLFSSVAKYFTILQNFWTQRWRDKLFVVTHIDGTVVQQNGRCCGMTIVPFSTALRKYRATWYNIARVTTSTVLVTGKAQTILCCNSYLGGALRKHYFLLQFSALAATSVAQRVSVTVRCTISNLHTILSGVFRAGEFAEEFYLAWASNLQQVSAVSRGGGSWCYRLPAHALLLHPIRFISRLLIHYFRCWKNYGSIGDDLSKPRFNSAFSFFRMHRWRSIPFARHPFNPFCG